MLVVFLLIIGLTAGSFGRVIVQRTETSTRAGVRSIITGRSECDCCHQRLAWYDMIPLFSLLALKGACRHCQQKISPYHRWAEIISAALITGSYLFLSQHTTDHTTTILLTTILRIVGLIALYDRKTQTLHTPLRILSIVLTTRFVIFTTWGQKSIVLAAVITGIFGLLYLIAKRYAQYQYQQAEGLGLGDVLIAPIIGSISIAAFSIHNIALSTTNIVLFTCYFCVLASISSLLFFGIQKMQKTEKKTQTEPSSIAFIPGMLTALIILILFADPLLMSI